VGSLRELMRESVVSLSQLKKLVRVANESSRGGFRAGTSHCVPLWVMGSEREARGSGSVEVLPTSAVGETASSVLGGEEGRLLLVRRVSIVFCGRSASSRWTLGSWQQNSI